MSRAHSFPRQHLTNYAANLVNSAAHRGKADEIPELTAGTQLNFRGLIKSRINRSDTCYELMNPSLVIHQSSISSFNHHHQTKNHHKQTLAHSSRGIPRAAENCGPQPSPSPSPPPPPPPSSSSSSSSPSLSSSSSSSSMACPTL